MLREGLEHAPESAELLSALAYSLEQQALWDEALALHARAVASPAAVPNHAISYARALLACRCPEAALEQAQAGAARIPFDQRALAYLSLCWRMLDDPRDKLLNDYEALVGVYDLPVPWVTAISASSTRRWPPCFSRYTLQAAPRAADAPARQSDRRRPVCAPGASNPRAGRGTRGLRGRLHRTLPQQRRASPVLPARGIVSLRNVVVREAGAGRISYDARAPAGLEYRRLITYRSRVSCPNPTPTAAVSSSVLRTSTLARPAPRNVGYAGSGPAGAVPVVHVAWHRAVPDRGRPHERGVRRRSRRQYTLTWQRLSRASRHCLPRAAW